MKIKSLLVLLSITIGAQLVNAQIIINEIFPLTESVELKNTGNMSVDVSTMILCNFPDYSGLDELTIESGSLLLGPGELLVVSGHPFDTADGELGLYVDNNFGSAASIRDYMEYGTSGHARASVAMAAGIWTMGDFVPYPNFEGSIQYNGSGNSSASWFVAASTLGAENVDIVDVCEGGTVATSDDETAVEVVVGDEIADVISFVSTDNVGESYAFIVTNDSDFILAVLEGDSNDFEGAEAGVCRLYGVAYSGTLSAEVDMDITDISADGCISRSDNFVEITRTAFVSVEEQLNASLEVYPNPTADVLNFQLDATKISAIRILDLAGRTVMNVSVNANTERLDMSSLSAGTYVAMISTDLGVTLHQSVIKK
jgi:hypothetical protein